MTPQIKVTGWDAALGAAVTISSYNAGRRNRRNRWTVHALGDHHDAVHPEAEWSEVKDPADKRKKVGYVFNIGHTYEADVLIDGKYEHRLFIDARDEYQIISYYEHPLLRVREIRHAPIDGPEDSPGDDEDEPPVEVREVGSDEEE